MPHCKVATSQDVKQAAQLLESIRSENPSLWPHGLTVGHFNPGDLFLISKQAGESPVGFVGWQERQINGQRVGLYSIGVLPEHRNQGIAKEAVSMLIKQKAANVDRVAALVVEGNTPSEKLAEALHIPLLHKEAKPIAASILPWLKSLVVKPAVGGGEALRIGVHPAAGAVNAAAWDYMSPHREEGSVLPFTGEWTAGRVLNTMLNAGLGAGASYNAGRAWQTHQGMGRLAATNPRATAKLERLDAVKDKALSRAGAAFISAPAKDLIINANTGVKGIRDLPTAVREAAREVAGGAQSAGTKALESAKDLPPWMLLLGAGLLTGGLGYGAHRLSKAILEKAEAPVTINTTQGGRLKVTLPTKNPGDAETLIDLPFDQDQTLSNALRKRLNLDARRRLYAETKQRIRHRIPKNIDQILEEENASVAGLPS